MGDPTDRDPVTEALRALNSKVHSDPRSDWRRANDRTQARLTRLIWCHDCSSPAKDACDAALYVVGPWSKAIESLQGALVNRWERCSRRKRNYFAGAALGGMGTASDFLGDQS